jgi:hypothetical protein
VTPPGEQQADESPGIPGERQQQQRARRQQSYRGPIVSRNLSPGQFKTDTNPDSETYGQAVGPIGRHIQSGLDNQQRFNYFKSAGMGAALRYATGLPPQSASMNNLYRQRALQNLAQRPGPGHFEGRLDPTLTGGSPSTGNGDADD